MILYIFHYQIETFAPNFSEKALKWGNIDTLKTNFYKALKVIQNALLTICCYLGTILIKLCFYMFF